MTSGWRVAGLSFVSGVILVVQLMLFSPFNSFHGLQRQNRGPTEFKNDETEFKKILMESLRGTQVEGVAMTYRPMMNHVTNRVGITEVNQDRDVFAPIIIGAGQGTTGTHLFAEATCRLGFVTLHYGVGCLPQNALIPTNRTKEISRRTNSPHSLSCHVSISPSQTRYTSLLQHHKNISKGFLSLMRKKGTDPVELKHHLVENLEKIIVWGMQNKVGLALHDTPYPNLIPEILKIVRKYYGTNNANGVETISAKPKPIIILSERNAEEFVERRTLNHGSYSWICRPETNNFINSTGTNMDNFASSSPFNFEKMNETTLEGGAFDFIGCINQANISARLSTNSASSQSIEIDQIFYSFTMADRLKHRQYLIDSMENFQHNMKNEAIFSYNVFDKRNKTNVNDLANWIKQSLLDMLITDGETMTEGSDFLGFHKFFNENKFVVEARRGHRRRHYGSSYGENRSESITDVHPTNFSTDNLRMSRIHLFKMKQIISLDSDKLDCGLSQ